MAETPPSRRPTGLRPQRPGRRRQPVRHAGGRDQPRRRRLARTSAPKRPRSAAHASQVTDIGMFLAMPEDVFAALLRHRVVHRARRARRACATAGCWTARLMATRPPRPPRPGRRRLGRRPRPRPRRRRARPGRGGWPIASAARDRPAADRHQPAAAVPGDGRAAGRPVGRRRRRSSRSSPRSRRRRACRWASGCRGCGRRWPGRGRRSAPRYARLPRRASPRYVAALADDTVVVSHFIAINAVIGACTRRRPGRDPQPRQHVGDGRRDVAGRAGAGRAPATRPTR